MSLIWFQYSSAIAFFDFGRDLALGSRDALDPTNSLLFYLTSLLNCSLYSYLCLADSSLSCFYLFFSISFSTDSLTSWLI
jgi:hypothetical protein